MFKIKKILCVLYFFPPLGGIGVQRALKFVKYMPEFEMAPVILTVQKGHNYAYDPSLLEQVPKEVRVYRTNSGETLWLRNAIEGVSSIVKKKNHNQSKSIAPNNEKIENKNSLSVKERIFKFIDVNFFIPDSKVRWYKHAIKEVNKIIEEEKIECIFSSSYPYTVHLIALYAKKKSNLPWIADFRDPWVGNFFMTTDHSKKRKKKDEKLELEVVTYADKIIMPTEPICEDYKKRYPQFSYKFDTITNGFDRKDFLSGPIYNDNKFSICYSGNLVEGENPKVIINVLEKLFNESTAMKNNIELKFIGNIVDNYKTLLANSRIKDNIKFLPYMPYEEALQHMKSAVINLMILPNNEASNGIFSGKIFDYIGCEKPILGVMPSSSVAAQLINSKKIGGSFNFNEEDKIYSFIKELYYKWESGENLNTESMTKCYEFDRKVLTNKLVEHFLEIEKAE